MGALRGHHMNTKTSTRYALLAATLAFPAFAIGNAHEAEPNHPVGLGQALGIVAEAGQATGGAQVEGVIGNLTGAAVVDVDYGGSTVTFLGTGTSTSTLTGSTTFYALSCSLVGTAKTLNLQSGSTQTVTGLLSLNGAAGKRLVVRSSTPGEQALLDAYQGAAATPTMARQSPSAMRNRLPIAPAAPPK